MQLRFTLNNDILGSHPIDNPDGWKEIKVRLERDPLFHSLVEKIEVPLIFYGNNGVVDGGYDYIKTVENTQGINAIIHILIEISDNEGQTFEDFYEGNLELSDIEEYSEGDGFYKLKCPIVQTDLWSKFWNRFETPVDLQSLTDLDGNSVEVISPIEINLVSQSIKQVYNGRYLSNYGFVGLSDTAEDYFGQIDFPGTLSEVESKFELPRLKVSTNENDIAPLFELKFDGVYEIDCKICLSNVFENNSPLARCPAPADGDIEFWAKIGDNDPVKFTATHRAVTAIGTTCDSPPFNTNQVTDYTYNETFSHLRKGDQIKIYWKKINDQGANYTLFGDGGHIDNEEDWNINDVGLDNGQMMWGESYLNVTASTAYQQTTTDALLIHDVFKSISDRITGQENSFYSEILGRVTQGYQENGCDSGYALMKGLHIRGYSFDDKPFFQSMKDAWEGADPIFNLGLGYDDIEPPDADQQVEFSIDFSTDFNA